MTGDILTRYRYFQSKRISNWMQKKKVYCLAMCCNITIVISLLIGGDIGSSLETFSFSFPNGTSDLNCSYLISVLKYLSRHSRIILIEWYIFRFNKLWVYSNSPLSTFCLKYKWSQINIYICGSVERWWNVSKTTCSGCITYLHKIQTSTT